MIIIDRFNGSPEWTAPRGKLIVSNVSTPAKENKSMKIYCPAEWNESNLATSEIDTYVVNSSIPYRYEHYTGLTGLYLKVYNCPSSRIRRSFSTPYGGLSVLNHDYINITKAELIIKKKIVHSGSHVNNVRLITEWWTTPTWANQPAMGDIIASFNLHPPVNEIIVLDITSTVIGWVNGSIPNLGLVWDAETVMPFVIDAEIPKAQILSPHLMVYYDILKTPENYYVESQLFNQSVDLSGTENEVFLWVQSNITGEHFALYLYDKPYGATVFVEIFFIVTQADTWELKSGDLINYNTGLLCTESERAAIDNVVLVHTESVHEDYNFYVDYYGLKRKAWIM